MTGILRRALGILLLLTALAMALVREPDWPVEALVARWAPTPSEFIELQGQLVHVRDEGPRHDPLPLVLVHGTSASLHTWEGWVAALRGTRRVITFDLPGFGLTGPNVEGDYRGDTYARFTLALMDHLQLQRVAIGGNSLGGEVAWRVAAMAPQRVSKLILVDAAGPAFEPESLPIGFVLARLPVVNRLLEHTLPRGMVEASVRNVYGNPAKVTPALVDRYFQLTLREGNRAALVQRFGQMLPGEHAERIAALKVPTLIIWGGRDKLMPPAIAQQFRLAIAGSELVVFDDLGHVPHEEDAARTVVPVMAFLARP